MPRGEHTRAGGREYSQGQRKIINRYYDNRETIGLTKLQEIVSELALAPEGAKLDRLWTRAAQHLKALGTNPARTQHVLDGRDPAALAKLITEISR